MNRKIFNHKILQESLKKRRHVQQLPSFKLLQYFSKKLPESVAERWKSLGPKQILSESKSSNSSLSIHLHLLIWQVQLLKSQTPIFCIQMCYSIFSCPGPDTLMRAPCQWHKYSPATFPESIGEERGTSNRQTASLSLRRGWTTQLTQVYTTKFSSLLLPSTKFTILDDSTRLCESSLKRSRWNMLKRCWKDVENIWKELKGCESMQGESRDPKIWGADTLESKTKDSQVGKHMKKLPCIDNCVT